ncbi:MAG: peptide-methionine (S)-S-oxide reductase MsrA [Gammaproteobacteria bacterium]
MLMKTRKSAGLAALTLGLVVSSIIIFTFFDQHAVADTAAEKPASQAEAIFAGGCFWCMEPPYDEIDGVISTISGYTDGHKKDPTYKEVSSGTTGHTEAIKITYDPAKVSYAQLVEIFWRNIDPVTPNRQFCDSGTQYRSGIYYLNDEQRKIAEQSRIDIEQSGILDKKVVTEIKPASVFYAAEDYHQDYYVKNPVRYKFYRYNCGRDQRLKDIWG